MLLLYICAAIYFCWWLWTSHLDEQEEIQNFTQVGVFRG